MGGVTYACSICRYVFDVDAGAFQTHMQTTHGRDVNVLWDGFKITADHQSPPPPAAPATALPRLSEDEIDWILTRHRERPPGYLFNGPQGACAACMQSYPCRVVRLLADLARTRTEAEAFRAVLEGMECHCVAEEHGGLHYAWCSYDKARTALAAPTPQQQPAERTAPAADGSDGPHDVVTSQQAGYWRSVCSACEWRYENTSPSITLEAARKHGAAAPSPEDEQHGDE